MSLLYEIIHHISSCYDFSAPVLKYAHNMGVESLSWLLDGQLLAVGSQNRNIQLYDLRMSGTNAPPISVFAHSGAVSGIVANEGCPTKSVFASFGRNTGEPVKLWDSRMMDSPIGEIRAGPCTSNTNLGVSMIAWSPTDRRGFLTIAIGNTIKTYDTKTPGSRSLPVEVSYVDGDDINSLQDVKFQPTPFNLPLQTLPKRILVVSSKGDTHVIPESYGAPVSVSKRDGRIAHAFGGKVWVGNATKGELIIMHCSISFWFFIFMPSVFFVKGHLLWKARCCLLMKTFRLE